MIDDILAFADKLEKVFATFKLNLILGVIINVIIIAVLFKLTEMFSTKLRERFQKEDSGFPFGTVIPIAEKVVKFLIVFIIVASFLQSQGYSLTSLIAGFGITGLAVGFAAQQTIASMFGTVAVLTDKVYRTGDYIKINNYEGTVEKINIRSTKIRTLDNFLVTIPNNIVADSIIQNVSKANKRRLDLTFGVTYDTPNEKLERAIEILKELINERHDMYKEPILAIQTLDSSSINIRMQAYIKSKAYDTFCRVRGEVYLEAVKRFRAEGINFAFPSTTVYMAK
mgnify:CR=1 FL=1